MNPFQTLDAKILQEYYEHTQNKKKEEEWLNKHRALILQELKNLEKTAVRVGNYQAKVTIPNNSKFDEDKVLEFLEEKGLLEQATKKVLDEEKLTTLIENGLISLEELKDYAWVSLEGSPRLTVQMVKE